MALPRSGPTTLIVLFLLSSEVRVYAARPNKQPVPRNTHLEPRPRFFHTCKENPGALVHLDVRYRLEGRTTVVLDIDALFNRTAKEFTKVELYIDKCVEAVSSNTCSPFNNYFMDQVCIIMMNPIMPWAKTVADVRPKFNCPTKAGRYSVQNATLVMDVILGAANGIKLEGSVWRTRAKLIDEKHEAYLCVDVGFEFLRVRNRPH